MESESDGESGGRARVVVALQETALCEEEDGEEAGGLEHVDETVGGFEGAADGAERAGDKAGFMGDENGGEGEMAGEGVDGEQESRVRWLRAGERSLEAVDVDLETALMAMWEKDIDSGERGGVSGSRRGINGN